jgi:hypothetical protein
MILSPELQAEYLRIMAHMRAWINRSVAQTLRRERERKQ